MKTIHERDYSVKECANPHCDEVFEPGHPAARYHDVECHALARGRTGKHGPKNCENPSCGAPLVRGRLANGKPESALSFYERRYCNIRCTNTAKTINLDVVEDVEWIIGTDLPERIAQRVGYNSVRSLTDALTGQGRKDLADRLGLAHSEYLEAIR